MGLRILSDELEALLRDCGLFICSGLALNSRSGIQGVVHNSSEIQGGELFIGLVGQKFNGGIFAGDAIERGAVVCLIDQAAAESLSSKVLESCIVVIDTLQAFGKLTQRWIAGLDIPIVVVTGSVGKTTVKELLAGILVGEGAGFYSQGLYKNHVDVLSTLCRADFHHKWGIVEIEINSTGKVEQLSSLFVARVAVVTCIAEAQLEGVLTREDVKRKTFDIVRTLKPGGVLIVNGDDDDLYSAARRVAQECAFALKSFGFEKDSEQLPAHQNNLTVKSVGSHGLLGLEVTLCSGGENNPGVQWEETFQLHLPGAHNGMNVAAAVACALELFPDLNLEGVKRRVTRLRPSVVRLQVVTTRVGVRILSDCSNSSPMSVHAFMDLARDELLFGTSVVLVVGEMRQLGSGSAGCHKEVFDRACALGAHKVFFVGEEFRNVFTECKNRVKQGVPLDSIDWFGTPDEAFAGLNGLAAGIPEGEYLPDLIMVKGPLSLGLEAVVDSLVGSFGGERVADTSQLLSP